MMDLLQDSKSHEPTGVGLTPMKFSAGPNFLLLIG